MTAMWGSDSYVAEAVSFAHCDVGKILIMGNAQVAAELRWNQMVSKYEGMADGCPSPFQRIVSSVMPSTRVDDEVFRTPSKQAPKAVKPTAAPRSASGSGTFREPAKQIPS